MNKRLRILTVILLIVLLLGPPAQAQPKHCNHIPLHVILIWYGEADEVPRGFALCDGTNGTPDLRGLFIMGTNDDYPMGTVGGQNYTIHTHTFSGSTEKPVLVPKPVANGGIRAADEGHTHTFSGITDPAGFDNRPEFLSVHFIMCVGK
jgi:hypothetical protein